MAQSRNHNWGYALVAPYAGYVAVLLLIPFINIALLSVYTFANGQIEPMLTLGNYARLFEWYYFRIFWNTLSLSLFTTIACAILGYPLAYYLARATPRIATLGLFLLVIPLMVNIVTRTFGWIVILGSNGLLNNLLAAVGLGPVRFLGNELAVVLGLVTIFMPYMVMPLMASIERIPRSIEEAAQNLGANWGRMFLRTILPLSRPGLFSASLLVYSLAIGAYVIPALMGAARIRMAGQEVYDSVLVSFNWPAASSLTMVLMAVVLVLMVFSLRYARRFSQAAER